jgi:hypothetical protein
MYDARHSVLAKHTAMYDDDDDDDDDNDDDDDSQSPPAAQLEL